MRDIGKNIKMIRQEKNITQEALAEALYVTRQTVSNYENGRSRPDLDMLLKIAEILETDVNTVIYGPTIPQSKQDSYKWLGISAGSLAAVTALYIAVHYLLPKGVIGYQYSVRLILQLTLLPAIMFILGWALTHCLSIFSNLQQRPSEKCKALRVAVLVVLGLFLTIPIPIVVFLGIGVYRSFVYHSVSMSFPYIPVYTEAFKVIEFIIFRIPFVYMILGSIAWLFGLPWIRRH